jgi:hypothetical protein
MKLHSAAWKDRSEAYEQLRSNPATLSSPKVRTNLLDLLDRENQLVESTNHMAGASVDEKYGEAYAEYLGELGDTVDTFADWNDPRQVCIFVHEPYNPESKLGSKIAAHAKIAMPCLLKMSSSDVGADRAESIAVLVQALAKGKGDVESRYVQAAKQQILRGLHDQDPVVRGETVIALGAFGETDMIPALQEVANSDPGSEIRSEDNTQWFPIREEALKAIDEIEKRVPSHN